MENQIVLSMTSILTILAGFIAIFGWFYKSLSRDIKDVKSDVRDVKSDVKILCDRVASLEKISEHRLTKLEMEAKNTNQRIESTNQRISEMRSDINQRLSTIEGYLVPKKVFHIEEPHDEGHPKEN